MNSSGECSRGPTLFFFCLVFASVSACDGKNNFGFTARRNQFLLLRLPRGRPDSKNSYLFRRDQKRPRFSPADDFPPTISRAGLVCKRRLKSAQQPDGKPVFGLAGQADCVNAQREIGLNCRPRNYCLAALRRYLRRTDNSQIPIAARPELTTAKLLAKASSESHIS